MDTLGLKIGNFCKKWMKTTNLQYKFDCKLKLSIICIIPFNMLNSGLALFIFTCIWLLISWFIEYKGAWTINKDNIHQWQKRFRHYKKQTFFFKNNRSGSSYLLVKTTCKLMSIVCYFIVNYIFVWFYITHCLHITRQSSFLFR